MSNLHEAGRDGDTGRVKQLLDDGEPVDEKDENDMTTLMWASYFGHTKVVRLLLDPMVKRLLEKGASLDEKDKYDKYGSSSSSR